MYEDFNKIMADYSKEDIHSAIKQMQDTDAWKMLEAFFHQEIIRLNYDLLKSRKLERIIEAQAQIRLMQLFLTPKKILIEEE